MRPRVERLNPLRAPSLCFLFSLSFVKTLLAFVLYLVKQVGPTCHLPRLYPSILGSRPVLTYRVDCSVTADPLDHAYIHTRVCMCVSPVPSAGAENNLAFRAASLAASVVVTNAWIYSPARLWSVMLRDGKDTGHKNRDWG